MRRPLAVAALAVGLVAAASLALAGEDAPAPAPQTPREDALNELGRRLFFDPAASRVGMRACADCHDPAHGYTDRERVSRDDAGPMRRRSQTIIDTAGVRATHWDGEFERVEDVIRSRLTVEISPRGDTRYPTREPREECDARKAKDPGLLAAEAAAAAADAAPAGDGAAATAAPDVLPAAPAEKSADLLAAFVDPRKADALPDAAARLLGAGRYAEGFEAAFGSKDVATDRIAAALQRYCHGVVSGASPYDRFAAGKDDALSPSAKRGLALFRGAAGCATCHRTDGPRAALTDQEVHNTGVSWRAMTTEALRRAGGDLGAGRHDHRLRHFRAFKTPTLRDVARRGPYMHDGSLATLEAVVRAYAAGPVEDPMLDAKVPKFAATDGDVADLVAFLESLTSDRRPGLARAPWGRRAAETRLTFVDADGRPLAGTAVTLVTAGDVLPGFAVAEAEPRRLTTGEDGSLVFTPPHATHVRLRLEGGLVPAGGDLVPDTCQSAVVVVPVRGRARVLVEFAKGATAPESLFACRPDATCFPGRCLPVSVLSRRETTTADDGSVHAVYDTPFRTDVGPAADVSFGSGKRRVTLDPAVPATVTAP